VVVDLGAACGAVLASVLVDDRAQIAVTNTLPLTWPAASVLAWAVWRGSLGGVVAALAVGASDLVVINPITRMTLHNIVLLLLAGAVVGHACTLYEGSRRDLAQALETAGAARERERLARDIHDSVLQVLAFVQRRGGEIGGETADLGRMAGEQESLLRGLVSGSGFRGADDRVDGPRVDGDPSDLAEVDLLGLLRGRTGPGVQRSGPAGSVLLPAATARDVAAAVGAALDNVRAHAGEGARAWVLVEEEASVVLVSVRDAGVGIAPGRLEVAAADGRMGVARSVRGRIEDHGGTVDVVSVPGQGTEIEMRVPRPTSHGW